MNITHLFDDFPTNTSICIILYPCIHERIFMEFSSVTIDCHIGSRGIGVRSQAPMLLKALVAAPLELQWNTVKTLQVSISTVPVNEVNLMTAGWSDVDRPVGEKNARFWANPKQFGPPNSGQNDRVKTVKTGKTNPRTRRFLLEVRYTTQIGFLELQSVGAGFFWSSSGLVNSSIHRRFTGEKSGIVVWFFSDFLGTKSWKV